MRDLGALPDLADFGKQNLKEFGVFFGQATATQRKQAPLGKGLGSLRARPQRLPTVIPRTGTKSILRVDCTLGWAKRLCFQT